MILLSFLPHYWVILNPLLDEDELRQILYECEKELHGDDNFERHDDFRLGAIVLLIFDVVKVNIKRVICA